ncbi:hypothetical protein BHM03_00037798 [Ensete ventricosum]|uniref:Arginase n=1 Tax=Ensete ventricosum TaxID=4639 RepID=A0A426Z6X7_ENSVE|nr:hypothetical protein B296_00025169 [Ensete ventricosum]RZS07035.1 hypothetical protein BHM03_00037798 [Ensete ventricosum]
MLVTILVLLNDLSSKLFKQKLGEGVKGVYISVDVDCLDPAFAPGVSHIEPGGLSFRDVLNILHNLQADVVAADVVEFNPQRDTVDGMTAMVAAKLWDPHVVVETQTDERQFRRSIIYRRK